MNKFRRPTKDLVIVLLLLTNALQMLRTTINYYVNNDSIDKIVLDNVVDENDEASSIDVVVHKNVVGENDEALSIDVVVHENIDVADNNPFAYDINQWRANHSKQRIVLLAGPHKTGSSGIQTFFSRFAGLTVSSKHNLTGNALRLAHGVKDSVQPHPAFANWIWPVGAREDYADMNSGMRAGPQKFYAPLASMLTEREPSLHTFFYPWAKLRTDEERDIYKRSILTYYRRMFDIPWKQGHNLIIGTEELDAFLRGFDTTKDDLAAGGEQIHAFARATELIDRLVEEVLPANNDLSHIEVQVSHRIPRIDHLVSVWKEIAQTPDRAANNITMRDLFGKYKTELVTANGLALALQFARRGIRATLTVMDTHKKGAGNDVLFYNQNKANESESIFGGFYGSVGCEIFELGEGVCDHENRMHLERFDGRKYNISNSQNRRDESSMSRNMTKAELDQIEDYLIEYDCSVWKYLRRYQAKGLLRVLNPSPGLFDECDYHKKDVSYYSTIQRIIQTVERI